MAGMTPEQAISQLKTLSPDQQRAVLMRVPEERRQQILQTILGSQKSDMPQFKAPATGMARVKEAVNTGIRKGGEFTEEHIPDAMATVGGLGGGLVGGPPGALLGTMGGAGVGKFLQRVIGVSPEIHGPYKSKSDVFNTLRQQTASTDTLQDVGKEMAIQGAYELGGAGMSRMGRAIFPTPRSRLIAFGAKSGELTPMINKVLPDIDETVATQFKSSPGTMTIDKYGKVLDQTGLNLENRFNLALNKVYNANIGTTDVGDAIMDEIKPYMLKTPKGRADAEYLRERAKEFSGKAWTIGELNDQRMRITKELKGYKEALKSGQAVALKTDAEVMADTAIENKLKDIVYDWADRAGRMPQGYFANLKAKEAGLIALRDARDLAESRLIKQSAETGGAPMSEHMRTHFHLYPKTHGIPGSFGASPRYGGADPFRVANERLAKAFPTVGTTPFGAKISSLARQVRELTGQGLRRNVDIEAESGLPYKAVATPLQRATSRERNAAMLRVGSLPIQLLFSDTGDQDASKTQQ